MDSQGNTFATGNAYANSPDVGQWGAYEKDLYFDTDAKAGTLEVFWFSPKDGSEIDKVSIPIKFK